MPIAARWVFAIGQMFGSAIFATFVAVVAGVLSFSFDWPIHWWLYAPLWVGYAALGFYRGRMRWARTSWQLDDAGLRIRRGWWFLNETLVPRPRVQHLDIDRGPIERRYGLATLTVYTAGTSHSAVSLAGLADADAIELRNALIPPPEPDSDVL